MNTITLIAMFASIVCSWNRLSLCNPVQNNMVPVGHVSRSRPPSRIRQPVCVNPLYNFTQTYEMKQFQMRYPVTYYGCYVKKNIRPIECKQIIMMFIK